MSWDSYRNPMTSFLSANLSWDSYRKSMGITRPGIYCLNTEIRKSVDGSPPVEKTLHTLPDAFPTRCRPISDGWVCNCSGTGQERVSDAFLTRQNHQRVGNASDIGHRQRTLNSTNTNPGLWPIYPYVDGSDGAGTRQNPMHFRWTASTEQERVRF